MRIGPRAHHLPRRPLLLSVVAALALGLAGRIAIHAGAVLPHGHALAAVGHTAVALGAPWLAVAWILGAYAGNRARGAASELRRSFSAQVRGTCSRSWAAQRAAGPRH